MTNHPPKQAEKHRVFSMRVDDEFFDAVDRLRGLIRPIPSKSEVVRMALMSELAARLEEKAPA